MHAGHRIRLILGALLTCALVAAAWCDASAASFSAGQVFALGANSEGQLGNGVNITNTATPELVALPSGSGPVRQVASGGEFTLVVTTAGQLYAFGNNHDGQLGNTVDNDQNAAHPTPFLVTLPGATGPVVQAAAGLNFSLALTSTDQLYAFGLNFSGQLGSTTHNNLFNATPTPAIVSLHGASGRIAQIAAGEDHSLVLTSTGQLYAFGANTSGQLANGTNIRTDQPNPTPTIVTLPGATGHVTQIAAGAEYSLALTSTNQLYAWGDNRYGQQGTTTNINESGGVDPTPAVTTLPGATGPVIQISASAEHSLALTATGQLYAFGDNQYGQLGNPANNGNSNANPTPTVVPIPSGSGRITQVEAEANASLALTSSGQVYGFGLNASGELGSGAGLGSTPNPTPVPIVFPGGSTIEALAQGPETGSSMAIVSNLGVIAPAVPAGLVGTPYAVQLQGIGGIAPYSWSATGLPPGLSIDAGTGRIAGVPSAPGTYSATVDITDADQIAARGTVIITVSLPPPPPSASVSLTSTSRTLATLTISCAGAPGQQCAGNVVGTTHEHKVGRSIIAVTARKRPTHGHGKPRKKKTVVVIVARASYSVTAGSSEVVHLALNATGRRLVAQFNRLPVTLTFSGSLALTETVVFSLPRVHVTTPPDRWFHINAPCGNCYDMPQNVPITGLPSGANVEVICRGGGCPFNRRAVTPHRRVINLASVLGGAHLAAGGRLLVEISAPNRIGEVLIYTMRKGGSPVRTVSCLPRGTRAPVGCT
jgi:alpha-tubulin suppressor-like RCC1 family protein